MNLFIRYFMAMEDLNSNSEPVGGVVGFLKGLNSLINTFSPQKVFVVWESGGPSPRRRKLSENYKANRGKMKEFVKYKAGTGNMKDVLRLDEEVKVNQILLLTRLIKTTPICQIFIPDTECDDVIGYLVRGKLSREPATKIIISSDKDFYQFLDDSLIEIYDPATKSLVTGQKVLEKYSVHPANFCLAKTLVGDESDNIEGVPGAGWKTVAKRFPIFSEGKDLMISDLVEAARQNLNPKKPIKIYQDVIDREDLIRRNWELMYLNISTLPASQISKVDSILDNHENKNDKLSFIKIMLEAGISSNLDIEGFFSIMRNLLH